MLRIVLVPLLTLLGGLSFPTLATAGSRYYVEIRPIKQDDASTSCRLGRRAADVIAADVAARPNVTTSLGASTPAGKRLATVLKRRKMVGYGLFLRVTRCRQGTAPNPRGGHRLATVDVAVALAAEVLPSGQLVKTTHGEATVGVESKHLKPRQVADLQQEALQQAVHQAIDSLLATNGKKASKHGRAKHHRKRRTARSKH